MKVYGFYVCHPLQHCFLPLVPSYKPSNPSFYLLRRYDSCMPPRHPSRKLRITNHQQARRWYLGNPTFFKNTAKIGLEITPLLDMKKWSGPFKLPGIYQS